MTPPRLKAKIIEGKEPTLVVMAPFTPKAVVLFDSVPITKTAKRFLHISNPTDDAIDVRTCYSKNNNVI